MRISAGSLWYQFFHNWDLCFSSVDISFRFLECSGILTNLLLFTVSTIAITKQFSVLTWYCSGYPSSFRLYSYSSLYLCNCIGIGPVLFEPSASFPLNWCHHQCFCLFRFFFEQSLEFVRSIFPFVMYICPALILCRLLKLSVRNWLFNLSIQSCSDTWFGFVLGD